MKRISILMFSFVYGSCFSCLAASATRKLQIHQIRCSGCGHWQRARVPSLSASILQGRSRENTWTPTMYITASCVLPTALPTTSKRSMLRCGHWYSVRGRGTGCVAHPLNAVGAIAGYYIDSKSVYHGFLRLPDSTITEFDAPDAGTRRVSGDAGHRCQLCGRGHRTVP